MLYDAPWHEGCIKLPTLVPWMFSSSEQGMGASLNFQLLKGELACAEERCHTHYINSPPLPSELLNGTSKPACGGANPPQPDSGLKCDQSAACTDRWALFSSLVVRGPRNVSMWAWLTIWGTSQNRPKRPITPDQLQTFASIACTEIRNGSGHQFNHGYKRKLWWVKFHPISFLWLSWSSYQGIYIHYKQL